MSEKCDKCGEVGEDRRTLWMACFYSMEELGLPFDQVQVEGGVASKTGDKPFTLLGPEATVPEFGPPGEPGKHRFYTLRVCKDCRASWMGAIKTWFHEKPKQESCGTGIFVRKNGTNVEVTYEEWERLRGIQKS